VATPLQSDSLREKRSTGSKVLVRLSMELLLK
jgi:hypothetical protein